MTLELFSDEDAALADEALDPGAVVLRGFARCRDGALAEAVEAVYAETGHALAHGDYVDALAHLARLRPQVDAFFDAVMVNVDDAPLRNNRLALLRRLSERRGRVAANEHLSG
jgi:glycyl-tRNA synthetase beta chain